MIFPDVGGRDEWQVLGLMSGTSADGIDGALVGFRPDGGFRLLWHEAWPFGPEVRARIHGLMKAAGAEDVARAAAYVAELHARAVDVFRTRHPEDRIDLLAPHGQTLAHCPDPIDWDGVQVTGTLQVLNTGWLAEQTGLPVVADFRLRDMGAGGQGAPLVPFGDLRFFGGLPGDSVALNVGGIANVTVLRRSPEPLVVSAFDTGPGNMMMDELMAQISSGTQSYDRDGALAATGRTDAAVLASLEADPYFDQPPPKSTGRDRFGSQRLAAIRAEAGRHLAPADLMSTLLDLTVAGIVRSLRDHILPAGPIARVIAAGGGALNGELMRRLGKALPAGTELVPSDRYGVPVMAREAMAFAALGEAFLRGRAGNVPAATGAKRPVILGTFTP